MSLSTASFFNDLGSVENLSITGLAAAGVVGAGSIPTTHVTTQVPATTSTAAATAAPTQTTNWLLYGGIALILVAVIWFVMKRKK